MSSDAWGHFAGSATRVHGGCDVAKAWDDFSSTADRCSPARLWTPCNALARSPDRWLIGDREMLALTRVRANTVSATAGTQSKAVCRPSAARPACGVTRHHGAVMKRSRRATPIYARNSPNAVGARAATGSDRPSAAASPSATQVALNNLKCCYLEEQVYNRRAQRAAPLRQPGRLLPEQWSGGLAGRPPPFPPTILACLTLLFARSVPCPGRAASKSRMCTSKPLLTKPGSGEGARTQAPDALAARPPQ